MLLPTALTKFRPEFAEIFLTFASGEFFTLLPGDFIDTDCIDAVDESLKPSTFLPKFFYELIALKTLEFSYELIFLADLSLN